MSTRDHQHHYERISGVEFIGKEGLEALQRQQIAIFGLGNIGHQTAYHLSLLGIPLTLVDHGVVEQANLATQGFAVEHIGQPKADALEKRLKAINPSFPIVPIHADIRALGMAALRDHALYLCCLDSLADRIWVNEMAYRMGIPWIDAALDGTGRWLYAKTAIYDPRLDNIPCYLCQWDSKSLHSAIRLERERADTYTQTARGCPNWRMGRDRGELSPPTLSISSLGGVIAGIQSVLALNLLLGDPKRGHDQGEAIAGMEITLNLSSHPFMLRECRMERNRRCLFDHKSYQRLILIDGDIKELTIERTFDEAQNLLGPGVVLQLHGRELIARLRCPDCRGTTATYKLADAMREADTLCACGGQMRAGAGDRWYQFAMEQAGPFLGRTWAEVGLPLKDVITATDGTREVHFVIGA